MSNTSIEIIVKDADGVFYRKFNSIRSCALHFNLKPPSILYRAETGLPYNGYIFEKGEMSEESEGTYKNIGKKNIRIFKGDDVELDREKYRILKYELRYKRVCVTPCPYKVGRKIFIGSALCTACKNFKGRNKQTQEIACNRKLDVC